MPPVAARPGERGGEIQPHGAFLAVLAEPELRISHASANLAAFLATPAEAVLGRNLSDVLGPAASLALAPPDPSAIRFCQFQAPDGAMLALHGTLAGRHICIDITAAPKADGQPAILVAQQIVAALREATSCEHLCNICVAHMHRISGYDRVLVLRFDADGVAEVFAEARDEKLEPFLGMHCAASNLSPHERDLLQRRRILEIADADDRPVAVLADPVLAAGAVLDIEASRLCGATPQQRAVMHDTGVRARLTVAVGSAANLAGLLRLYHATPRVASADLRCIADIVGQYMAQRIGELSDRKAREQAAARGEILRSLIAGLAGEMALPQAIEAARDDLLALLEATGAVLRWDGKITHIGQTPPPEVAERTLTAMLPGQTSEIIAFDDLGARVATFARHADCASGALILLLNEVDGDAIAWFRPEQPRIVLWGGSAERQIVHGRCKPWSRADMALAREFREAVAAEAARRVKAELGAQTLRRRRQDAELQEAIEASRRRQGQLESGNLRLERAQSLAGIGTWEMDVRTGAILWSKEMYRLRGLSPEELDPTIENTLQYVHEEDREARARWLADLQAGHAASPHEYRIRRPDGEERLVRVEGGAITDEAGTITHLAGTFQDITDRRQIERRLAHAQKMESLGYLTGGMAHDFNNMLAVIGVNLDLLRRALRNNPAADELAAEAQEGANRCADLVRGLLAFARRQPLQPERTDVNMLVREICRLLKRTLGVTVQISLQLCETLWPAAVDRVQLEAAVVNLATNARDAMPGGGELRIATRNCRVDPNDTQLPPEIAPGDYVVIEFADTGTGIAPEALGRIFEPFFTTKSAGNGTGLGLSMAFGFARQSGGNLTVYSELGVGSIFRLYLPRTGAAARPSPAGAPAASDGARGETVLVVEDNAQLRRAVTRQLNHLGYQVREAEHAGVAIEILSGPEHVDLLFSDLAMPGEMDGRELARRAAQLRPGLPILLTSGFAGQAMDPGPGEGVDHPRLLTKPYSRDQLAAILREMLRTSLPAPAGPEGG